jgi:outer membrane lipoprotein-sorting protein
MTATNKGAPISNLSVGAYVGIIILSILACFFNLDAQGKVDPELQRIFGQMNDAGKSIRSYAAKFSKTNYTAVIKQFDTPATGDFFFKRAQDGSALLKMDQTSPGKSILTVMNGVATQYQPGIKQALIVNLGKHRDKIEYLIIGNSESPEKLQQTFNVSYQGSETINGKPCSVLLLKPKNPNEASYISSITLWLSKSNGMQLRNKLQEPSGDYILFSFSDEKLNVNIPNSKFDQKLPSGTDIQRRSL